MTSLPGSPLLFTMPNARVPPGAQEAGSFLGSPPPGWAQSMASDHSCPWPPELSHSWWILTSFQAAFSLKPLLSFGNTWVLSCLSLWGEFLDPHLLRALSRYIWF